MAAAWLTGNVLVACTLDVQELDMKVQAQKLELERCVGPMMAMLLLLLLLLVVPSACVR